MKFTHNDMQACIQYCADDVNLGLNSLYETSSHSNFVVYYTPGCNFAIVNFGGEGFYRCVKYNKMYISVDPFRPGNQDTNIVEPFSPRVIAGRLMMDDRYKNVDFSWATVYEMKADVEDLLGKTERKGCSRFCVLM